MSTRSVIVRLEAEVSKFVSGMGAAAKAAEDTAKAQEDLGKATEEVAQQSQQASETAAQGSQEQADATDEAAAALMAFGAVSVAALGASAKAAMDWESAWAGVTKTVDGSPEQMDELEASLRGLAKTLPATHEEIAGVAEAAGQLGVVREDVVGFTKTMVDLGNTTNLTADEAATSIAQISNVMGTMARDGSGGVERFGATLVALGNAGASTEKEILEMAKRIAGAGKLVGASESDVLALSNALASVGIEAQLGGGVMSRVMQRMYGDVKKGGEGLDNLAKVAGVSSKELATAFETDPIRAVDMMVKGLSRVKDAGGNVVETMDNLGIKGTEETGVILRLAGAGDLLSESLKLGDSAWQSNSALAAEAAKRYETTESKVKIAWNNIKDAAIDAGAVMLPAIQGIAEAVSGLAQMFGSLPKPVQGTVVALAAVVGGAALLGGALLSVTARIASTQAAFLTMTAAGSKAPGMLMGMGKAAGIAAAAYLALAAGAALASSAAEGNRTKTTVEGFSNALIGVAKNGDSAQKALDAAFKGVLKPDMISGGTTHVNSFADALDRVFTPSWQDNSVDFASTLFGQNATSGINAAKDAIGNYDKSLASMATSGNFEDASAGFRLAAAEAKKNGTSIEDLVKVFPQYKDAILANKTANGETQVSAEALTAAMLKGGEAAKTAEGATGGAAKSVEGLGLSAEDAAVQTEEIRDALEDVGVSADGTIANLDKFTEALLRAGLLELSARDAARGFQEAIDAVGESVAKNGTSLDTNTEKGRANEAALDAIAGAGIRVVEANAKNGASQESLQGNLDTTYQALINGAGQFDITGTAAEDLARDILGIPPGVDIKSWMSDEAKRMAEATKQAVDNVDGRVANVTVNTHQNHYETTFHKLVGLPSETDGSYGKGLGVLAPPKAAGGDLDMAPGPKGVDSQLFYGAKGEHVLTAQEVDQMGGQQAVYRFRAQVRNGQIPAYASGGGIGAIASPQQFMSFHTPAAPAGAVDGTFEGNLFLDSGEFLGKVRGLARQEAAGVVATSDGQSRYARKGR